MLEEFSRTKLLLGEDAMNLLKNKHVAVFGVGGVGSFAAEAIARCGVGKLSLFDKDTVSITNINRQLIALHSTVGKDKVDVMRDRIKDINPNALVYIYKMFYLKENADQINYKDFDYVVDCIDTVSSKLLLTYNCFNNNIKIISSMGAGNKLNPTMFEISDIFKTTIDPLAKVMRKELKKLNVTNLKVVYSKEEPLTPLASEEVMDNPRKQVPGSISFTPSVVGLIIASEVIKDLIN